MDFIFGPITSLLGWLASLLYEFFGNYGLAIIFLTIIVRGLTVPLNVRSAKAMMKQQALSDKQAEIKRKYPDDKQKQQEELQKLFQENGASTFAGCIVPFLPIFFLFPTYYIVQRPLQYITGVSKTNIKAIRLFVFMVVSSIVIVFAKLDHSILPGFPVGPKGA